ncbi:MAG TPA: Lrp/AsnC family transcriptional regulator [Acidimicrobiia bacterium]
MTDGLDEIDRLIIRELQEDARQSNVALAKKAGLTEGAVRRRVDRLMKAGAFRIVAVGDPNRLGLQTHAIFALRCNLAQLDDIASRLAAMRELSYVYETTGRYDVMAVGFFASNEKVREFITEKLAREDGVTACDTFMVMRTVKRSFRWGEAADDDLEATSDG